jgi:hypothetical protein
MRGFLLGLSVEGKGCQLYRVDNCASPQTTPASDNSALSTGSTFRLYPA